MVATLPADPERGKRLVGTVDDAHDGARRAPFLEAYCLDSG